MIRADAYFNSRSEQLAALALRYAMPAIYQFREFVLSGGLASFGTTVADTYRSLGVYTGRILKGEKPADLPVQQASKVELLLNLKTAKALGLAIPPTLLARATEVIDLADACLLLAQSGHRDRHPQGRSPAAANPFSGCPGSKFH